MNVANGPAAPGTAVSPPPPAIPRAVVLAVSAYIAAQMLADVASLKIGTFFGLAVDMGTFVYPVTFTLRDVCHKVVGRRAARTLILAAAGVNLFMAAYLWLCARAPSDPSWALGPQFAALFAPAGAAGVQLWRIVLASIVAEVASELADTEVYHWFVTRVTRRRQWLRVLVSNGVSVPVDNVVFALGAFGGALPWPVVGQIFLSNLALKCAVTVASIPLIYTVRDAPAR